MSGRLVPALVLTAVLLPLRVSRRAPRPRRRAHQPEAIQFDFVQPARPRGRLGGVDGLAWLDEAVRPERMQHGALKIAHRPREAQLRFYDKSYFRWASGEPWTFPVRAPQAPDHAGVVKAEGRWLRVNARPRRTFRGQCIPGQSGSWSCQSLARFGMLRGATTKGGPRRPGFIRSIGD